MEVLYQLAHYSQMQSSLDGKDIPEVVCYEKQSRPGGMWNLDWRVGKKGSLRYILSSDKLPFVRFWKSILNNNY